MEDIPENDAAHQKLIKAISKIGGDVRNHFPRRSEPEGKKVSEFNLPDEEWSGKVRLHDLIDELKIKKKNQVIRKQVRWADRREKVLPQPLEKPKAHKIQRQLSYHRVTEEIAAWDSVVERNRVADQLVFPLRKPDLQLQNASGFLSKFKPRTPLEEEVAKILHGSSSVIKKGEELSAAEKEAMSAMSVKEALQRRQELGKLKAIQSYSAAKSKRQNKIKSKKYHRILRHEKIKKQMKEFEELQKKDPEAALKKLEELEKARILERSTLKHRNTSKWSQMQAARAKYNRESRQKLSQELKFSRELTQKVKAGESSDEGEVEEGTEQVGGSQNANNPWIQAANKDMPTDVAFSGYRKFWEQEAEKKADVTTGSHTKQKVEKAAPVEPKATKTSQVVQQKQGKINGTSENLDKMFNAADKKLVDESKFKLKHLKRSFGERTTKMKAEGRRAKKIKVAKVNSKVSTQSGEWKVDDTREESFLDEGLDRLQTIEDVESKMDTEAVRTIADKILLSVAKEDSSKDDVPQTEKEVQIDPKKIVTLQPKKLDSELPDMILGGEDDSEEEMDDDESAQRMTIVEAFKDDDVVAEFRAEKKKAIESSKPKAIDLSLPGWGEWGGHGRTVSRAKRRRFLIKPPPLPPRTDNKKNHVILNEKRVPKFRKHLVSDLPFPFTKVEDYEKSIRAPVGNTWVPETAFRAMVAPKVITKLGTVIKPIDRSVLSKPPKENKKPWKK